MPVIVDGVRVQKEVGNGFTDDLIGYSGPNNLLIALNERGAIVGLELLRSGDTPPDFTLEDQNGRAVTLSAEWKSQPVVLIFYRGHW